jgi:hypothetical protein
MDALNRFYLFACVLQVFDVSVRLFIGVVYRLQPHEDHRNLDDYHLIRYQVRQKNLMQGTVYQSADGRKCQPTQVIQNQFNLLQIPPCPARQCAYFIDALNNPHELHLSACEKNEVSYPLRITLRFKALVLIGRRDLSGFYSGHLEVAKTFAYAAAYSKASSGSFMQINVAPLEFLYLCSVG